MKIFWIDLFCGAGGTTTGIHLADANVEVVACVNHDAEAIRCHKRNHPSCLHFTEDIRNFNVILKLREVIHELRKNNPGCIVNIWASLEFTHFSNAKGGLPRDEDSRTLALDMYLYLDHLNPDFLYIENVREFLTWGPLDSKGKPISEEKGKDYKEWVRQIKSRGYEYEYRLLNSADFGAHTSRLRYFGIFAKKGMPIAFPERTHANPSSAEMLGLLPWKPVRELLDLEDEGRSIFGLTKKGKPYSENTLKRIYAGLVKFSKRGLFPRKGENAKEKPVFLTSYYGNGSAHSADQPCNTLTTKERFAAHFINYDYSTPTHSSLSRPAGTIMTNPKHNLVT